MTVKELIEKLKTFNPKSKVLIENSINVDLYSIEDVDSFDYSECDPINETVVVEMGRKEWAI